MDTSDFKEHFDSLLTESEEHLSTLDQFLVERLEQAEINDPQTVIAGIDAVLDSIDSNHENLTTSKQNGRSRTAWLQQNLMKQTSSLKENQAAALIDSITSSMVEESSATINETGSFSGLDAVEKVRNLDQALIETTCRAQAELQTAVLKFIGISLNPELQIFFHFVSADGKIALADFLTVKNIGNCRNGFQLKAQIGIEFEFLHFFSSSSIKLGKSSLGR